jgi:hypothetical protein
MKIGFEPALCATNLGYFGETKFVLKIVTKLVELDGAKFGLKIAIKSVNLFCCKKFSIDLYGEIRFKGF